MYAKENSLGKIHRNEQSRSMKTPPPSKSPKYRTILLATVGTSPAVLTETVWALSHPAKKGEEDIVPDEVVVVTTKKGKDLVLKTLFGQDGAWRRMVAALKKEGKPVDGRLVFGEGSVKILSDRRMAPLDDIRTTEDNEAAADFLLREVESWAKHDTRILASIAGGRKTMGSLLLSCMILRARTQDRVLHVLVNEPFDGPLAPPFFFPKENRRHAFKDRLTGKTKEFRSSDAKLDLIDLPFVKTCSWYQDKFKTLPSRYGDLVRAAQDSGPEAGQQHPELKFDFGHGLLLVNGKPVKPLLSPVEFTVLSYDLLGCPENLLRELPELHETAREDERAVPWFRAFGVGLRFSPPHEKSREENEKTTQLDLTKVRSDMKKKLLKSSPEMFPFIGELFPRGARHGEWPEAKMSADIPDFWKRVLP